MRAGGRSLGEFWQPPVEVGTVEVHQVWGRAAQVAAKLTTETRTVVLVIGVGPLGEKTPQVIPNQAQAGLLCEDWCGKADPR